MTQVIVNGEDLLNHSMGINDQNKNYLEGEETIKRDRMKQVDLIKKAAQNGKSGHSDFWQLFDKNLSASHSNKLPYELDR